MVTMLCGLRLLLVGVLCHGVHAAKCRPIEGLKELSFVYPPSDLVIECYGATVKFHCCMRGAVSIQWLTYNKKKEAWIDFLYFEIKYPSQTPLYEYEDDNQTAVISKAEGQAGRQDDTQYRCQGVGINGRTIEATANLTFRDCSDYAAGPEVIKPSGKDPVVKPVGSDVTLTCKGFLGPDTAHINTIFWLKKISDEPIKYSPIETETGRVSVITNNEGSTHEKTVRIEKLEDRDYGDYYCLMSNRNGNKTIEVILEEGDPDATDKTMMYLAVALASVVGLSLLVLIILCRYRDDARLWYQLRIRKKYCKEGFRILLLHDKDQPEVCECARAIQGQMERLHYHVDHVDLIRANETIFCGLSRAADDMSCLILVVSDELLQDVGCRLFLQEQLARISTVLIMFQDISEATLNSQISQTAESNNRRTLRAALRVASKVTWPGNEAVISRKKDRKVVRFWKKLHLKLISYVGVPAECQSRNSLTKPLLEPSIVTEGAKDMETVRCSWPNATDGAAGGSPTAILCPSPDAGDTAARGSAAGDTAARGSAAGDTAAGGSLTVIIYPDAVSESLDGLAA